MMILGSTPHFGNTPTHAQRLGRGEADDDDDDDDSSDDEEHLIPMGMSPDMGMRPGELTGFIHTVGERACVGKQEAE